MTQSEVVVLGETAVDVVVRCGPGDIEWGQAEQVVDDARLVLGSSGAITAAALAALGVDTSFVGVVGGDHLGDFFVAELGRLGVRTADVTRSVRRPTGMTVVLERSGDRALLTAPGTMGDLTVDDVAAATLRRARHVHVSSYFLQVGLHAGLPGLLAGAREAGTTTSLDPGWDPRGDWDRGLGDVLAHLDWFLPNRSEATRVAGAIDRTYRERVGRHSRAGDPVAPDPGAADPGAADPGAAPTDALDTLGRLAGAVAVKLGASGAAVHLHGVTTQLAADPIEPVDTTGAGDNFDAGFIAALLSGAEPLEALALGMACGRSAVGAVGGTGRLAGRSEAVTLARQLLAASPPAAPTLPTIPTGGPR